MEKVDLTGVSPEITEYILRLETQLKEKNNEVQERASQIQEQSKTVESLHVRIERLTDMLAKLQKSMYGQSSEKSKYVLGEETDQLSLFNEAETESNSKAPEPSKITVTEHIRKAKRTKEELAADLPVVEIHCEADQEKLVCEECGANMRVSVKKLYGKN